MIDLLQLDRVLDVGGWFKPNNSATHVVDLMPYETRGAALHLDPHPGERFKKDTWFQANFLDSDFRLPFEDDYFDFVTCGHTVEDLTDPIPLLSERKQDDWWERIVEQSRPFSKIPIVS